MHRHRGRLQPGAVTLDLDRLVSPLRYDVVVRERYLDFLEEHLALYFDDFDAFDAKAREHPYFVWFRTIAIHRIAPGGVDDEALTAAFRERLRKTTRLFLAFRDRGFDPTFPIVVRQGGPLAATVTGKVLTDRWFPVEGCHRLALLRRAGHRRLHPSWYRVRTGPGWAPPDNTHALLRALEVPGTDYYSFVALGYGERGCDDPQLLLAALEASRPELVGEVGRILEVDSAQLA